MGKKKEAAAAKLKADSAEAKRLTEKGAELKLAADKITAERADIDKQLRMLPPKTFIESGPYQLEVRGKSHIDLEALHKKHGKKIEVVVPKQVIEEHRKPSLERAMEVLTGAEIEKFRVQDTPSLYYGLRKDAK